MSIGFATAHGEIDDNRTVSKTTKSGEWEIHSWGNARLPGVAVVSAIATLQLGATLAEVPGDKIAMNKAVEYLMKALAPQLRNFQQELATGENLE